MYFFIVSYSTSSRLSGIYNNNKNGPPYSVGPHYAVSAQVVTACSSLFFWPFSGCNQIDIPSGLNLSPFSYYLFVFFWPFSGYNQIDLPSGLNLVANWLIPHWGGDPSGWFSHYRTAIAQRTKSTSESKLRFHMLRISIVLSICLGEQSIKDDDVLSEKN